MNGLNYLENLVQTKSITLVVADGDFQGNYYSSVTKIDNDSISIIAPISNGTTILFHKGEQVEVTFTDNLYTYMFITRIIGRSISTVPSYILNLPEEILKFSKRNYIRVLVNIPVYFQSVDSEAELDTWKKGKSKDLSGGGLCFSSYQEIGEENFINIRLVLPDTEIKTLARICRFEKKIKNKQSIVSVEFVDLPERERDIIIRYVFYIQRTMLKKGLT